MTCHWEVWSRQVAECTTHTTHTHTHMYMEVEERRSKGWVIWTHCNLWALIFLSVKLGFGQMKAKALPTSPSL